MEKGRRTTSALVAVLACALVLAGDAAARGGSYTIAGGTARQQQQVRLALEASAFDFSRLPATVQVHIAPGAPPRALRGHVWLDARLLDAGMFSWAVVQDEFAHQVDYFLLDDLDRAVLNDAVRGRVWCHGDRPGLPHAAYGCERFSSTFVWAYWPSPANAYRPASAADESASMEPVRFRSLLESMLARPRLAAAAG